MVTLDWVNELGSDIGQNLDAQISFFERQGRQDIADIFRWLKNQRDWQLQGFQNDLIDQFASVADTINPTFEDFLSANEDIYNRVVPEIRQNRQLVEEQFGPWGEMQRNIDSYYSNLINAINNEVAWGINMAQWQAQRAWASRSAINQAIQEARQWGIQNIAQAEAEKISQQQNLLQNLLELRQGISDRQFDKENELIRKPILDIGKQIQDLSTGLLWGLQNISNTGLQYLAQSGQLWNLEQLLGDRVQQEQPQQDATPQPQAVAGTNNNNMDSWPTAVEQYIRNAQNNTLGSNQQSTQQWSNTPPRIFEQDLQAMGKQWARDFLENYRDTYWIQSQDELRRMIQPWTGQNNVRESIRRRNTWTSQPQTGSSNRPAWLWWNTPSRSSWGSSILEQIRSRNLWT